MDRIAPHLGFARSVPDPTQWRDAVPAFVAEALAPAWPLLTETPDGWTWPARDVAHRLPPAAVNAAWEALDYLCADDTLLAPWTTVLRAYTAVGWAAPHAAQPALAKHKPLDASSLAYTAASLDLGTDAPLHTAIVAKCAALRHACAFAAQQGAVTFLAALRAYGSPWDATTCAQAAKHGQLAALQWAAAHGCVWNSAECLRLALTFGYKDVVAWLVEGAY